MDLLLAGGVGRPTHGFRRACGGVAQRWRAGGATIGTMAMATAGVQHAAARWPKRRSFDAGLDWIGPGHDALIAEERGAVGGARG